MDGDGARQFGRGFFSLFSGEVPGQRKEKIWEIIW